ncbi:gypsy retrotransposon integrase-like protein 1 [Plakobranchus ocellatus]|uniref:Gypsy retrotransposon integrase-like protein 1 n=1 Tax=Plakobranchus ocellatus TaxID=259542 RepID=A0AAV3Y6G7_9GAST|nr:gypsy retrotransposon integrase-like protein 1 [Plakobranchus ocellatus]
MSELDLYARYLDLGVKLGRSREDLATWVEDKVRQDMERNDRQIERERKREEMELQKQERESERQLELRRMELKRLQSEAKKLLDYPLSDLKDSATSFAGESVISTARSDSRRPPIHSYRSQTHTRANTPSLGRHTSHTSSGHRPPTHGVHSFGKSNKPFPTSKDNPRSASHQRNSKGAASVKPPSDGACYYCGKKGHFIRDCRRRQADLSREAHVVCSQQYNCCIADAKFNRDGRLHIESASLFGNKCSLLRDTGCITVGVRRSLVPVSSITGRRIKVNIFCCKNRTFDTAVINISSPYFSGRVEACLLTDPVADVILGDIDGIIHPTPSNSYSGVDGPVPSACVVTRAQARKTIDNNSQNNMVPSYDPSAQSQLIHTLLNCVPLTDVGSRQKVDPTLKDWFNRVGAPPVGGVYFTITEGKLYQRAGSDIINTTIAVPESLRHLVLQCAHDNCLSGQSGFKKALSNIQAYFSWPGILNDVRCYTRSCHVCQVRPRVRSDRPAPFQPVTLVEIPFQRVIIDIVGPLPVSQNRYEYILTLVDLSTRWAEGVPLRHISAKDVAQSLFDLFCRLGFPCEIQSDRGQQFMSQVLREFNSLTNIKHFLSSPYHPQTNGVVERFHSTLKEILRKLAFDSPSNWCQYLNAALFAYRCQVHTSTGYSPFFLLYGRSPRGPVEILHDFMSNSNLSPETSLQYQFVIGFHNKLKAGWQLAASALKESADKSREHQSLNPRVKTFAVDEQVLVLLPSSNNKLSLTLQGPFNIAKKLSPVVYLVDFGHRVSPLHVNLLRKYHRDSPYQIKQPTSTVSAENTTAKANAASH